MAENTNIFDETNNIILAEIKRYHERALATTAVPAGFRKVSKAAARKRWIGLTQIERDQEVSERGLQTIMAEL